MKEKTSPWPKLLPYLGSIISILYVLYSINAIMSDSHRPSPVIDLIVYIAALIIGFFVIIFVANRLLKKESTNPEAATLSQARLKLLAAIISGMCVSGAIMALRLLATL